MTALVRDIATYIVVDGDAQVHPCTVRLAWHPCDPFAISWTFMNTPQGDVRWTVAREMLGEALISVDEFGDPCGDVHMQRYVNACAMKLTFRVDAKRVVARTCTTPLTEFVTATYRVVAPGSAVECEAVDHALADLLARATE